MRPRSGKGEHEIGGRRRAQLGRNIAQIHQPVDTQRRQHPQRGQGQRVPQGGGEYDRAPPDVTAAHGRPQADAEAVEHTGQDLAPDGQQTAAGAHDRQRRIIQGVADHGGVDEAVDLLEQLRRHQRDQESGKDPRAVSSGKIHRSPPFF